MPEQNENYFTSILNNAFAMRKQELEQAYQSSLSSLNLPVDKQIGHLKDKYKLREYQLRRTQLTDEDFSKQMQKLVDSYEQEGLKIGQRASMKLDDARMQLQQEFTGATAKLEANQQRTLGQVDTLNYLVSTGRLPEEEAQQELYKLVGIEYKPKTVQEQFQQIDSYVKDLETEFRNYFPPTGRWKKGERQIQFSPTGFKEDMRPATEEELINYHTLLHELTQARRQRGRLRNQIFGTHIRIAQLQSAYLKKARKSYKRGKQHLQNLEINKDVFTQKFSETGKSPTALTAGILQEKPTSLLQHYAVKPIEKQPTAEELKKLRTREAYKQGVRLGYWK